MEFTLEKFRPEFAASLARNADNPAIARNLRNVFPNPYTPDDASEYIEMMLRCGDEKQFCRAVVVNGEAVGSIGFFMQSDVYEKSAEIGYWLGESFQKHGIITKAVGILCDTAFEHYGAERVFAEPYERNYGSRKVLENNGFTLEGTIRNGVYKNGELINYCIYSLLKKERENKNEH